MKVKSESPKDSHQKTKQKISPENLDLRYKIEERNFMTLKARKLDKRGERVQEA